MGLIEDMLDIVDIDENKKNVFRSALEEVRRPKAVLYTSNSSEFESNGLGILRDIESIKITEERNGIFELELVYPINSFLFGDLVNENIIKVDASDTLKNQLFRIYNTVKIHSNRIKVFARHISFDLVHDRVRSLNINNQSCQYVLNEIFRNSQNSKHFRGYSDIQNAQSFHIERTNCLSCIAGTKGSVIDTFGTGPDILRDNFNIHVLNRRGNDDNVLISYSKNLTDIEIDEDYTDMITHIFPFAKVRSGETESIVEVIEGVKSPRYGNYKVAYCKDIDFSDKFENEEVPTQSKLIELANKYFESNKCDIPKTNFKINFVSLGNTEDYKEWKDLEKVGLGDKVIIRDKRFNVDTQARVIKVVYNPLTKQYDSIELGEPKTTLGNIVGNGGGVEPGPPGPQGPPGQDGADGNIGDFPNSLPNVPQLEATSIGFSSVELSWTYENKVYYEYEVYASQIKGFKPNVFDLIFSGKGSAFLHEVAPNQTWYYRARAVNTHGNSTELSSEVECQTRKISDAAEYFDEAAINHALIGSLNADKIVVGRVKGTHVDARNLTVTDGNGKRTLDIDSFGNIRMNPSQMQIQARDKVEFISNNNNLDMLLYGGQMCAYNNMDNTFIATVGAILNDSNTFKGTGFIGGKHCTNFVVSRDPNWDNILTSRDPSPTTYMNIDFVNNTITIPINMITGNINMRANSLYDCNVAYIKDLYSFGWKDFATGKELMKHENDRIIVSSQMSFNGNILMNPDLYTNKFNFTNGYYAFGQHESGANVMMNGIAWDWQGWDIVNAVLRDCTITNTIESGYDVDVENDVNVLIANDDISTVNADGTVEYDVNDMFKLLYTKINSLEKEIEVLKAR